MSDPGFLCILECPPVKRTLIRLTQMAIGAIPTLEIGQRIKTTWICWHLLMGPTCDFHVGEPNHK